MRSHYRAYKKVGRINASISKRLGFDFEGSVYASPGVINHIKRHHGKQLTRRVKENLIQTMERILNDPDYIGVDKGRGRGGALELIKKIDNMLLLGLEVDLEDEYIYVSTLYPITKGKINSKVYSGKVIKFSEICDG